MIGCIEKAMILHVKIYSLCTTRCKIFTYSIPFIGLEYSWKAILPSDNIFLDGGCSCYQRFNFCLTDEEPYAYWMVGVYCSLIIIILNDKIDQYNRLCKSYVNTANKSHIWALLCGTLPHNSFYISTIFYNCLLSLAIPLK